MLKKVFVAITFCICVTGLTFSMGCGGGPGAVEKGKASKSNFGKGVGTTEDGEDVPDGVVTVD